MALRSRPLEFNYIVQYQWNEEGDTIVFEEKENAEAIYYDMAKIIDPKKDEWVNIYKIDSISNITKEMKPVVNEVAEKEKKLTSELQTQFQREKGIEAFNSQGEPDIDYVAWLESKIIKS